MSVSRSLLVLTLLILGLPVAIFTAQQSGQSAAASSQQFENLQLYEVTRDRVELSVNAIGTIEAEQVVTLSFLSSGRVAEVLVQRDDYVLPGDPLARLDSTNEQIAYERAVLNLERAELDMDNVMQVDEDAVRRAEAQVDAAWGAYLNIANAVTEEDIRAAEESYQNALEYAQYVAARRDQAPGGYGGDIYNQLDAQAGEASFNAEIARLQLEQLRTQTAPGANAAYQNVLVAQSELERVKAGPTDVQIETAAIGIRQAESQLERAAADLERRTLTAPIEGVISAVNVESGALVGPGVPAVTVTDVSPLLLTVQVDEIDIGLVEEGLPVRVSVDALPDVNFDATVADIASVGQNQEGIVTYDVSLDLGEVDPRVRVGMTAEATIIIEARPQTLVVPNLYIRLERGTGRAFVNVLREDQSVEEVEVELGLRGQSDSEILSGLEEGDLVALDLSGSGFNFLGG